MTRETVTALFEIEGEAERAATQLRAAGIPDDEVSIAPHSAEPEARDDEVGVPDSAASFDGLRGGEVVPEGHVRMTVGLGHARLDQDEIVAILNAAGGRLV